MPFAKLKDYATSKKDMKKGIEILPEEQFRMAFENIYPEGASPKDKK